MIKIIQLKKAQLIVLKVFINISNAEMNRYVKMILYNLSIKV